MPSVSQAGWPLISIVALSPMTVSLTWFHSPGFTRPVLRALGNLIRFSSSPCFRLTWYCARPGLAFRRQLAADVDARVVLLLLPRAVVELQDEIAIAAVGADKAVAAFGDQQAVFDADFAAGDVPAVEILAIEGLRATPAGRRQRRGSAAARQSSRAQEQRFMGGSRRAARIINGRSRRQSRPS